MRTEPRPAQLVLSRNEHWKSVRGAYATRKGLRVDKLRVLLVDDVMTTGATLDACSRALKKCWSHYRLGVDGGAGGSWLVAFGPAAERLETRQSPQKPRWCRGASL